MSSTSSSTLPTKQRILEHARIRFNEEGLHSVGVRDLARELGLSPGNLSYYFATKRDLIAALATMLSDANDVILARGSETRRCDDYLRSMSDVFANQYHFRCLLIFVPTQSDREWFDSMRRVSTQRRAAALRDWFSAMQSSGSLKTRLAPAARENAVGTIQVLARFWLSHAQLSFPEAGLDAMRDHYLRLIASALLPCATERGLAELSPWLSRSLLDERTGE